MKLDEALRKENYIYAERYLNNFKKVENKVSKLFCAMFGLSHFPLPYISLNKGSVKIITSKPHKRIYKFIVGKEVKFFIHPEMIDEIRPHNLKWEYTCEPTSSTRTVFLR